MKSARWWDWLRVGAAVLATLLAMWVIGAIVAGLLGSGGAGLRGGLGLAAALVVAIALPLWLEHVITKAMRRRDAGAEHLRSSALLASNLIVLALAGLALPGVTRTGLGEQASWPSFGTPVSLLDWAGRGLARLLEPKPTEPSAPAAPSAASALAPTATASSSASSDAGALTSASAASPSASAVPADAGPPVVADHDLDGKALFSLRADSAVLIRTREPVSPSSVIARVWGATVTVGQGSGVLVDASGLIVTNQHVVEGASALLVRLHDGRSFGKVSVVATLKKHDLALIAVEAGGLPHAPLADAAPSVGERVFAIGNPLGLDFSLSEGIVSALRVQQGTSMVQIQTAIGPGSSGGPLFDVRGRLLGVTTAATSAGLHFAVDGRHLRELLALDRAAKALDPWMDATRVEGLQIDGPELGPTAKASLGELAGLFGTTMEPCLTPAGPATATLRIVLARDSDGTLSYDSAKGPETTLEGDQASCASKAVKSGAFFFAAALSSLMPAEAPPQMTVRFRLVRPREGGGQRSVDVEVAVAPKP